MIPVEKETYQSSFYMSKYDFFPVVCWGASLQDMYAEVIFPISRYLLPLSSSLAILALRHKGIYLSLIFLSFLQPGNTST